jgi:hypothetical protein
MNFGKLWVGSTQLSERQSGGIVVIKDLAPEKPHITVAASRRFGRVYFLVPRAAPIYSNSKLPVNKTN